MMVLVLLNADAGDVVAYPWQMRKRVYEMTAECEDDRGGDESLLDWTDWEGGR